MADNDPVPDYPLYNSTFSAYRLSPLYHGSNPLLHGRQLRAHARRLKDLLRGDTLRGVDVHFLDVGDNRGTLEECSWDLLGDEESWDRMHQENEGEEEPGEFDQAPIVQAHEARGIHVRLQYQKATHSALILRDPETTSRSELSDFTSLPLLLVRMPSGVRDIFLNFLTTTFDTRIAPLQLQSSFLSSTLETLFQDLDADPSIDSLADVLTGPLQLQFSFPNIFHAGTPAPLRSIDLRISQDDVPEFLSRGTQLVTSDASILRAQPQPTHDSRVQHPPALTGPFTAALSAYLSSHLALPLTHPAIHMSKVVVPPLLALSADAKVKLIQPASAGGRAALTALFKALVAYATTAPLADGVSAAPRVVMPLPQRPAKARKKAPSVAASGDAAADATAGLEPANARGRRVDGGGRKTQQNPSNKRRNDVNTNPATGAAARSNGAKKRRRAPDTDPEAAADANAESAAERLRGDDRDDSEAGSAEPSPSPSSSQPASASASPASTTAKRARRDNAPREDAEQEGDDAEEEDEDELAAEDAAVRRQSQQPAEGRGAAAAAKRKKVQRQFSVPAEPPPPYELHDPARAATATETEAV
ncbi:kinetochore complex Sim4 subunit Fta1-domain-containing protein [Phyllosticta capitalensis]